MKKCKRFLKYYFLISFIIIKRRLYEGCGILLHISQLSSNYGIGTFGKEAYKFVDFLVGAKQTFWQILPLGHTSYGDSPYQTMSTYALNPYFIDLDYLVEDKLLKKSELSDLVVEDSLIDYGSLYEKRYKILRLAFNRFDENEENFNIFCQKNSLWLSDYALFMAIKDKYEGEPLINWDILIRKRDNYTLECLRNELKEDILFYEFLQYKAFTQYFALKSYANQKGIKIIGDLPIYVSMDSSDVWTNSSCFQVDENLVPLRVAGVPPDLFSENGQLWGNPLYNWEYLKENNYEFWVNRIKNSFVLFDYLRIDHFIGFENFYSIPYGAINAKDGYWVKGPGIDLFNYLKEVLGELNIIAEDLGVLNESVINLLNKTGFTRMKVTQFAFDSREESDFLPHNYEKNTICYTGTHDNMTTKEWFESIPKQDYNYCLKYMNYKGNDPTNALIKMTLGTVSKICIIPLVDYLEYGKIGRMNVPSTTGENWKFRISKTDINSKLKNRIKDITTLYGESK